MSRHKQSELDSLASAIGEVISSPIQTETVETLLCEEQKPPTIEPSNEPKEDKGKKRSS
jgi:hypothetical protein